MSDPSLALQGAIVAALKGDAPTTTLISGRVFDRVPPVPDFPYVTIGDDQVLSDAAECLEGSVEIHASVHVWSRAPGKVEAKRIAGAIVSLLNFNTSLVLAGYVLVSIQRESVNHLDDPDGLTSHSVVTFRALIDEA